MKIKSMLLVCYNLILVVCLFGFSNAQATLLSLNIASNPDIFSSFIQVNYDSTSDNFTAQGFAIQLYDGSNSIAIQNGDFDLIATIDQSGTGISGSLNIQGSVPGFSGTSLLTGNYRDFGFPDAGGSLFEFVFDVTGGALAPMYGGVGSAAGVIIGGVSGFNGSFTSDFSNAVIGGTATAVSDTAPAIIPIPASLWLLGTGIAGLLAFTRRKK